MRFRRISVFALVSLLLVSALAVPAAGAAPLSSPQTIVQLTNRGTTTLSDFTEGDANDTVSLQRRPRLGKRIPNYPDTNPSPPTEPPAPPVTPVIGAPSSVLGFDGISQLEQRFAGTGIYENSQFTLEPPDPIICAGNGYVLQSVNVALQVYDRDGGDVTAVVALNEFFELEPEVIRSDPPVFGDFSADPKCYYDTDTGRWFLTILTIPQDAVTGAFLPETRVQLAVSQSSDPTGTWNLYELDTTNDGTEGTPSRPNCPCLGDQPLIGADKYGFYITTNEFSLFGPEFNGALVYAISKRALAQGATPPAVLIDASQDLQDAGGPAYSIQPQTVPPGGAFDLRNNGTSYFLSALDFNSSLDNRIAVWALTNTRSLRTNSPNLELQNVVIASQVYGQPPPAEQKDGPRPLGESIGEPLELLNTNDDRMQQVIYADGKLWSALNTIAELPDGSTRTATAYFVVKAIVFQGQLAATIVRQGYIAVNGNSLMFPAVGVNAAGKGVITFTLVGPNRFPSAAYAPIEAVKGAGTVRLAAEGTEPEDGFTGYVAFGGNGVARWGDYSGAVADADGSIWLTTEYIPGGPRTLLANWGTFVMNVEP